MQHTITAAELAQRNMPLLEDGLPPEAHRLKEWCAELGCSYETGRKMVNRGELPASRVGGSVVVLVSTARYLAMRRIKKIDS